MWIFQRWKATYNKVLHAVCSALSNPPNVWQQVHKDLLWSHPDSFNHIFLLHFTFLVASWSTQALHWGPTERRRASAWSVWASDSQQKCPPGMWRWMGCVHTHLLPVAVCSQGPVGSPSQRCPVVVEVASRVHLVLQAQNSTPWLENSLLRLFYTQL